MHDFTRFFTYSKRVRKYTGAAYRHDPVSVWEWFPNMHDSVASASNHVIPSTIWRCLLEFIPKPLFPNLQYVSHTEMNYRLDLNSEQIPFQSTELLFGPKLKIAEVVCPDPFHFPERPTELVRSLSGVAPSLEDLSVIVTPIGYGTTSRGSLSGTEVGLFHRLTSFSGRSVSIAPDALTALGRLPCLTSLLLQISPAEYPWDALPHGRDDGLYGALQQLALDQIPFVWSAAFLHLVSTTSLQRLSVVCEAASLPPPDLPETLCTVISELPSARSIEELIIGLGQRILIPREVSLEAHYGGRVLAPLFALTALRHLDVQGRCRLVLNDIALEGAATGWPHIKKLVFGWQVGNGVTGGPPAPDSQLPEVTLAGLLHLTRRCPEVGELALAVDMRTLPGSCRDLELQVRLVQVRAQERTWGCRERKRLCEPT